MTQAAHKDKIVRNVLSAKQTFLLTCLAQAEYSKQPNPEDAAFAVLATERLGFPVTKHNVQGCRNTLDIPHPHPSRARSDNAEIADLQRRILILEQRVQVYLDGCCKDSSRKAAP
jgi:hypothetical protein